MAIRLRLDVLTTDSGLVGFDETVFFSERPMGIGSGGVLVPTGNPDGNTFALLVAATLPFKGGAGSGPPPQPHRAVLLARTETDGVGQLTNVKIAAYPFDEIVATVLETPRLPPVPPDDQHPK